MLPVLLGDVAERVAFGAGDAGRVDEDVDVPLGRVADFVSARLRREVGDDGADALARAAEETDREVQFVLVEVREEEVGAVLQKHARRFEAYAAGGAGDERRAAFDSEIHACREVRSEESVRAVRGLRSAP